MDVTIADFVADARAATPSHAAELAVPDQMELRERLQGLGVHMVRSQGKRLELLRRRLHELSQKRVLTDPLFNCGWIMCRRSCATPPWPAWWSRDGGLPPWPRPWTPSAL